MALSLALMGIGGAASIASSLIPNKTRTVNHTNFTPSNRLAGYVSGEAGAHRQLTQTQEEYVPQGKKILGTAGSILSMAGSLAGAAGIGEGGKNLAVDATSNALPSTQPSAVEASVADNLPLAVQFPLETEENVPDNLPLAKPQTNLSGYNEFLYPSQQYQGSVVQPSNSTQVKSIPSSKQNEFLYPSQQGQKSASMPQAPVQQAPAQKAVSPQSAPNSEALPSARTKWGSSYHYKTAPTEHNQTFAAAGKEFGVNPWLLSGLRALESAHGTKLTNDKSTATGDFQFVRATGEQYGKKLYGDGFNFERDLLDPKTGTEKGARMAAAYLADISKELGTDNPLDLLAAYHEGVAGWNKAGRDINKISAEGREYVMRAADYFRQGNQ